MKDQKGWQVQIDPFYATEDKYKFAKTNRFYKLQPHRVDILAESDINVYIDGNKELFDVDRLLYYCNRLYEDPNVDAYFYNHEHRTTVRQELQEIIKFRRDEPARVLGQFKEYWDEGFRDDIQLIVASVQIRKTHSPELQELLDCWWNEVSRKSYRDQISWPYSVWKTGFSRFERLDVKKERFNMIRNVAHRKVLHV